MGQRLGTSLFELNTLGHALCALLIYCLWWNKPLDTKELEPIFLREEQHLRFVARLCARSTLDESWSELERMEPPIRCYRSSFEDFNTTVVKMGLRLVLVVPGGAEEDLQTTQLIKKEPDVPSFAVISISGSKWVAGLGRLFE